METEKMTIWTICLIMGLAVCAQAHESKEKLPDPGYRPECDKTTAFISSLGECSATVYPTIVRTVTTKAISYDERSQQAVAAHLVDKKLADPNVCNSTLDLSKADGQGQWEFFESSIKLMGKQLEQSTSDYHTAVEVLVFPGRKNDLSVFGIHVYVLDQAGNNAFSFLLNSHHKIFVDAKLYAANTSTEAKEKLIADSTKIALQALDQQIQQVK